MDVAAQNASLDNDYGTTHGPNSPASFTLALFSGDPLADGVEISDTTDVDSGTGPVATPNGYARAAVAHSNFAPSVDGQKATIAPVQFAPVLEEWTDTATHWQLIDASTGAFWDRGLIADPYLTVTGPGVGPSITLSVFYSDSVQEPA